MVFRPIFRLLDTFLMEEINCESVLETYVRENSASPVPGVPTLFGIIFCIKAWLLLQAAGKYSDYAIHYPVSK